MQNLTAFTPYRSGHALATALVAALSTHIAFSALSAVSLAFQILTGVAARVPTEEELSPFDLLDLGMALLLTLIYVVTIVLFCVWVYRAYANLTALGNPKQALNGSPAWAVLSFFIPIVHLVAPYRSVRETWAKSDPAVPADDYVAPQEPSAPGVMKLWWAFWLCTNFISNAAFRVRLRAETETGALAASWLEMLSDMAAIPAAVFAILVIREIDRRQEQRSGRVTYAASTPPPPPLFTPQAPGAPTT